MARYQGHTTKEEYKKVLGASISYLQQWNNSEQKYTVRIVTENEVADGRAPTTSKTVTRQKGERIVQVLKNDPASRNYCPEFPVL